MFVENARIVACKRHERLQFSNCTNVTATPISDAATTHIVRTTPVDIVHESILNSCSWPMSLSIVSGSIQIACTRHSKKSGFPKPSSVRQPPTVLLSAHFAYASPPQTMPLSRTSSVLAECEKARCSGADEAHSIGTLLALCC